MTNYIYRIDPLNEFRKINDGLFRARRYRHDGFPHEFLRSQLNSLEPNEAIYRICFYSDLETTKKSLQNDFAFMGPCVVHKTLAEHLIAVGFQQIWDDGFKAGIAPMFWIAEMLNGTNETFSNAAIGLDVLEHIPLSS